MSPPPLSLVPTTMSPPPVAIESDTDTDNYTDTDAESDAPSTSTVASSLPSPPCEFESEGELGDLKLGQYTKLAPRVTFLMQILGTVVGAVLNCAFSRVFLFARSLF